MSVETHNATGGTVINPIAALYGPRRITPGDAEWPDQLDNLEPPVAGLWVTGSGNLRDALVKSICCSGARASSSYGEHVATELGADLAARGWTVTTGGAFGIDAAALRGSLGHRQPAVIVVACGLNQVIPVAHASLFAEVLAAGGLMVSEYAPECRASSATFRRRSQLLGALARGVVLVEAAPRSSSNIVIETAEAAATPVFAVPGPITSPLSATPHTLIREDRAILATSAAQIIESYGPNTEERTAPRHGINS